MSRESKIEEVLDELEDRANKAHEEGKEELEVLYIMAGFLAALLDKTRKIR